MHTTKTVLVIINFTWNKGGNKHVQFFIIII